jgi:SAM-dependent methyltransferase
MWASGDYPAMVETWLTPLGPRLVDAAGIQAGQRVLDIAAGTGNASIPAAQRGASVVASDLTPELLVAGELRAAVAGVDLEWVVADAEALPFEDASFDVVMSAIGVMFAPHHQTAADELVRVSRPGGTVAVLSWTPEGMLGSLFKLMGRYAPTPPPGVQPPPLWGVEAHAREMFTAAGVAPEISRELVVFRFDSVADAVSEYADHFGPFVMARSLLEPQGRWDEFITAFRDLVTRFNPAEDGGAEIECEYYLITADR